MKQATDAERPRTESFLCTFCDPPAAALRPCPFRHRWACERCIDEEVEYRRIRAEAQEHFEIEQAIDRAFEESIRLGAMADELALRLKKWQEG